MENSRSSNEIPLENKYRSKSRVILTTRNTICNYVIGKALGFGSEVLGVYQLYEGFFWRWFNRKNKTYRFGRHMHGRRKTNKQTCRN